MGQAGQEPEPELLLLLMQSSSRTMVSGSVPGELLAFFPEFEAAEVDVLLLRVNRSKISKKKLILLE